MATSQPTEQLTANPSIRQLTKQAKALKRAVIDAALPNNVT